ncbi:acyl-CoA dehydratase activase-related protein, partial [Enterococcus faecalis]|uniref:acyl-CoA dehydratase activase-related protein n=1 Tax=Enterococcus faecalis TaxID=1351 RepID=UPI003D6BFC22
VKREEPKVNLVDYNYPKLFSYRPLRQNKAFPGRLGIPRLLNIYQNYPLSHTFFTHLPFPVQLSPPSNKQIYQQALETIPSHTVSYPPKIA